MTRSIGCHPESKKGRVCAIEGCDVVFIPWMRTQIYCSRKCQYKGYLLRSLESRERQKVKVNEKINNNAG